MNTTNATEFGALSLSEQVYPIASVVVPIFFSLIAITGVIGNVLVILVVILNPQMRSTTNLLIVNLAIADLLFLIFCIPFTGAQYITETWYFGEIWCKMVQYLIAVTVHASIYILVLMSVDRFLAVVHPVSSRSIRTEYNTKIAIGVLWTVMLILSLPVSFAHGLERVDNHTVECQLLDEGFLPKPVFYGVFFATSYVIPLIAICCLYIRMIDRLWHTVVGNEMSSESQKGRRRVTRLVVVVVVAFALLWLPIQLILILRAFNAITIDSAIKVLLQIFAQILAYTSSCINPLLYAFLSKNFRTAFQKVISCGKEPQNFTNHILMPKRTSRMESYSTTL